MAVYDHCKAPQFGSTSLPEGGMVLLMAKHIEDPILDEIVRRLKEEFHPRRAFLYGSRARGDHRADSDYDFVLVVDEASDRMKDLSRARQLVEDLGVSADVFVYSQEEFDEWKDDFSSIPETALNTGRELNLG